MVPLRGVHRNRDGFHRSRSSAVLARRGISARSEGLARLRDPLPRNLLVDVLVLPELPDLRVVEGHQSDDLLGAGVPGDRKSTRLNSSYPDISPLSLHDALPIFPRNLLVDVLVLPELPDLRVVEGHQSDDLLGAGVPGLLDVQAVLEVLHAGDEVSDRLRLAIQDVPDLCGVRVLRFLEVPEVVVDSLEDVLEVLHERIPVAYRLARI